MQHVTKDGGCSGVEDVEVDSMASFKGSFNGSENGSIRFLQRLRVCRACGL